MLQNVPEKLNWILVFFICCVGNLSENASAMVKANFPSEKISKSIQKALEPETKTSITGRSKVKLNREGKVITLAFEAEDTTALRASMNSYLSWLQLLKDLFSSLET
jgi:KEOPS complex subunit Pcc1